MKFYEDRFDWDQVRQNDAAGLLKMFIRELPYPLLTQQHLPAFTAAQSESERPHLRLIADRSVSRLSSLCLSVCLSGISSPKHQIQALHLLIMLLPEANRDTLKVCLYISSRSQMPNWSSKMS